MMNVLKSFVGIVVSCFGIGFSLAFPEFLKFALITMFVALDLVGIFFVFKYSTSDLWGVFYTFCPSLAFTELIREGMFIGGTVPKMVLLSLEYSFISVLLGLLAYSVMLCLKKI